MIDDFSASGSGLRVGELEQINRYARRALTQEDVYVFSVALCDNDIDRDCERFDDGALETLARLFVGKTGIFDHSMSSRDQCARIHSAGVETVIGRTNALGQPYRRLVARAYIPRIDSARELIAQIDTGTKREVSVSCAVGETRCSICGADLRGRGCDEASSRRCAHRKGETYAAEGGDVICHAVLSAPTDAYEWSFVAVPAQVGAGVLKSYSAGGKGGEAMDMEQICKRLESDGETALTQPEKAALARHIERLEKDAAVGAAHRERLRAEAAALITQTLPSVSGEAAEKMLAGLDTGELEALRGTAWARGRAPGKPQLAPASGRATADAAADRAGNQEFQI